MGRSSTTENVGIENHTLNELKIKFPTLFLKNSSSDSNVVAPEAVDVHLKPRKKLRRHYLERHRKIIQGKVIELAHTFCPPYQIKCHHT